MSEEVVVDRSVLDSVVLAKTILYESERLIHSLERHASAAGIVLLQDAVEIVFHAALEELGPDDGPDLSKKSFDELIGELKRIGVAIPRSGTIKRLNKQRVLIKHYGQLADAGAAISFLERAREVLDFVCVAICGRTIDQVLATDLLLDGEAKSHLAIASSAIDAESLEVGMEEIRRAIFVEFEADYSIDYFAVKHRGLLEGFSKGRKAPHYKRNMEWIEKNVHNPTGYVQVDEESLRLDCLEWGISSQAINNIRALTPQMFRAHDGSGPWLSKESAHTENGYSFENARYCLDQAVNAVWRKQRFFALRKPVNLVSDQVLGSEYAGTNVLAKADLQSDVEGRVEDSSEYTVHFVVDGFDGSRYMRVSGYEKADSAESGTYLQGYVHIVDT